MSRKPSYQRVKAMSSKEKKELVSSSQEFSSTGLGTKVQSEHRPLDWSAEIYWIVLFSTFGMATFPLIYLSSFHGIQGHGRKNLSTNLLSISLTTYFVVLTTSTLAPAKAFREFLSNNIQDVGLESPQLSLVVLASTWVSVCVVRSYQVLVRSIVTWKLFARGVQISHIAAVVDPVSEKKIIGWGTIISWMPGLVGVGANVIATRCFKIWVPQLTPGADSVPAGGRDMYLLIVLLVVAFAVESISLLNVAMPVTARHLMEWSNASTRTGACGTHPGWSHLVRLVAVRSRNGYAHLEFQDQFGSLEVGEDYTWNEISIKDFKDSVHFVNSFYGHGGH